MNTETDPPPIVPATITRWTATGLDAATLAKLMPIRFASNDLPGPYLGETETSQSYMDHNAAGHGWFVDPAPASDAEFTASSSAKQLQAVDPRAVDRIDLLTVVEHELGHSIGLEDLDALTDDLMDGVARHRRPPRPLAPGCRRRSPRVLATDRSDPPSIKHVLFPEERTLGLLLHNRWGKGLRWPQNPPVAGWSSVG